MKVTQVTAAEIQIQVIGQVPEGMSELARAKVSTLLRHVGEPVLAVDVMLTMAANPAVGQPAAARVMVSVNGLPVRAHATGETMRAAIDLMAERLRVRLAKTGRIGPARHRARPAAVTGTRRRDTGDAAGTG